MELIRLTENDLKSVIKESVDTVLRDLSKTRTHHASFDNPISCLMKHPLDEALIKTYPMDKTIKYIKNYFNLSDDEIYPLDAFNGEKQIAIKVPIIGNNLGLVKKAFAFCGYYLGYPKEKDLKPNTIYELQFEKKFENDISKYIRENETTLLHLTPIYNLGKIRHIGISPKSKNASFDYPSRAYFIFGSKTALVNNLAWQLNNINANPINQGKYAVIKIDINRIPNHVKFYSDPNARYSVYTYDNIPPNAIIEFEEIDANFC